MTDKIEHASPELAARARKAASLTDKAIEAYENHNAKKSLRYAEEAVATESLTHIDSARLVELFRVLGAQQRSDTIRAETLQRIEAAVAYAPDIPELLFDCGHVCIELGEPERAEPILRRAHELKPADGRSAILLMYILLERGEPDAVTPIFDAFLGQTDKPGPFFLLLAKAFGQFGFRDHARKVLENAAPHFADDPVPYKQAMSALTGEETDLSQRDTAAQLFDDFAKNYDSNLKAIGNNGPEMVARALVEIGLKSGAGLKILDAGCGTGLCAPYLRPYADHVHGCDVSVKMLEICKEKRVYDLLTRTDLGMQATLPQGPFDLVASGDVFVYFAELDEVLQNLASVTKPGGWLVFTVEDCSEDEPPVGFRLMTSGRYSHGRNYLVRALTAAGFSGPKVEFTAPLRNEFRKPIPGRAIAAQRLAFGFAAPGS